MLRRLNPIRRLQTRTMLLRKISQSSTPLGNFSTPVILNTTKSVATISTLTSDAFTPTANSLLVVIIRCLSSDVAYRDFTGVTSTITGQGTFIKYAQKHQGIASRGMTIAAYISRTGESPTAGTITANWTTASVRTYIEVVEYTGHDAVYTVGGMAQGLGAGTTLEVTLNGTPQNTSSILAAVLCASGTSNPNIALGTGFTELSSNNSGGATAVAWGETCYTLSNADTTVDWSNLATVNNVAIAIEINLDKTGNLGGPYTYTDAYNDDISTCRDTLVSSNNPTFNYGAHVSYQFQTQEKMMLFFDLSRIPSGATCTSAVLTMVMDDAPTGSGSCAITVYSIASGNGGWIAGTKDIALAGAGEPCWNAKEANGSGGVTTAWAGSAGLSTSGTDYNPVAIGSTTVDLASLIGTEYSITLPLDTVAGWFGLSNSNYGILLLSGGNYNRHFGQSDNATYRPRLDVTWTF